MAEHEEELARDIGYALSRSPFKIKGHRGLPHHRAINRETFAESQLAFQAWEANRTLAGMVPKHPAE